MVSQPASAWHKSLMELIAQHSRGEKLHNRKKAGILGRNSLKVFDFHRSIPYKGARFLMGIRPWGVICSQITELYVLYNVVNKIVMPRAYIYLQENLRLQKHSLFKKDKYGNYFVHDPFKGPLTVLYKRGKKNRGAESSPLSLCLTNNLLNSPSNPGWKFMKQSFQEASSSPTTTLHTCVTHGQVESHQQVTKQGLFLPSVASAMKQSFSKSSTTHVPLNAKISILC